MSMQIHGGTSPRVMVMRNLLARVSQHLIGSRATIVDASPLTVDFGDGSPVPVLGIAGLTYTSGEYVTVLMRDGAAAQPIAIPVTKTP